MTSLNERTAALEIDIQVQSSQWDAQPAAQDTVRAALRAAAQSCPAHGEIGVLLADDAAVRALNREWRKIDKPTNVLSFPAATPLRGVPQPLLGDIAVAYETLARESREAGKPFLHHLAHLAVHGFLHLMGYDHETDSEAEAMEKLERDILVSMNIADPYGAYETGNA